MSPFFPPFMIIVIFISITKQVILIFVWIFQSLVAISEVTKTILKHDPKFSTFASEDFRFLLISIGTGSNRGEKKYDAKTCALWGPISWIFYNGSTPITDVFMEASSDMVSYHNTLVFEAFRSKDNFLRIEVYLIILSNFDYSYLNT